MKPSKDHTTFPRGDTHLRRWLNHLKLPGLAAAAAALLGTTVLGQNPALVALDDLHGYAGTLIGPTAYSAASRSGLAEDFCIDFTAKGGSGMVVSNASFLNLGSSNDVLCVSFWLKQYDVSHGGSTLFLYSPSTERNWGFQAHIPWLDDNVYFDTAGCCDSSMHRISGGITLFNPYNLVGSDSWWMDWHHFVLFKNQSDKQIWIDGELFLQGSSTSPLPSDFTEMWLGGWPENGSVHGLMDDFAVYSTALSSGSISLLYSGTSPTNLPGEQVLAYWGFNSPPAIGRISGCATGFSLPLSDTIGRTNDISTLNLTLDGQSVPCVFTKRGLVTMATYNTPPASPFLPASTHEVVATCTDTTGNAYSSTQSFVVEQYVLVTTNQLLAASAATSRGFKMQTYQIDAVVSADMATADNVLAGMYGANVAASSDSVAGNVDAKGFFTWTGVINFDLDGPFSAYGHFNDPVYLNAAFPGIPGNTQINPPTENFVCQLYTALSFPSNGMYTMVVNCDDGFQATLGMNPFDRFGTQLLLAQFDGKRTAADKSFVFYIPQAGLYPFRLLHQQADASSSLEWFMVNADGTRVLINDTTNAISAYQWTPEFSGASYISSLSPGINEGSAEPGLVSAVIVDGANAIEPGSVTLKIDGRLVTTSVKKVSGRTTVSYVPTLLFSPLSTHTAVLGYQDGSNSPSYSWSFTVTGYALDKTHNYLGLLDGTATFTAEGAGHSGRSGDYGIDQGSAGTGYITVPDASFLNVAASNDVMTFAMWMKKYDIASGSAFDAVSPSSGDQQRAFSMHVPWENDRIYFDTAGCCGADTRMDESITAFPPYATVGSDSWWTNWHHFVGIKSSSIKEIWIDGQLLLQGETSLPLPTDITVLYLGYDRYDNVVQHAVIDDFAAFGSALSPSEIQALYTGTAPDAIGPNSRLMAYWPFDDAPPATVPTIDVTLINGKPVIRFTGTLTSAATVHGPYTAVTNASSPYTPTDVGSQFFRAQN